MSAALAALGYVFVRGASGDPSDWVLRQTDPDRVTEGCAALHPVVCARIDSDSATRARSLLVGTDHSLRAALVQRHRPPVSS
jgi:hypothetical protein